MDHLCRRVLLSFKLLVLPTRGADLSLGTVAERFTALWQQSCADRNHPPPLCSRKNSNTRKFEVIYNSIVSKCTTRFSTLACYLDNISSYILEPHINAHPSIVFNPPISLSMHS